MQLQNGEPCLFIAQLCVCGELFSKFPFPSIALASLACLCLGLISGSSFRVSHDILCVMNACAKIQGGIFPRSNIMSVRTCLAMLSRMGALCRIRAASCVVLLFYLLSSRNSDVDTASSFRLRESSAMARDRDLLDTYWPRVGQHSSLRSVATSGASRRRFARSRYPGSMLFSRAAVRAIQRGYRKFSRTCFVSRVPLTTVVTHRSLFVSLAIRFCFCKGMITIHFLYFKQSERHTANTLLVRITLSALSAAIRPLHLSFDCRDACRRVCIRQQRKPISAETRPETQTVSLDSHALSQCSEVAFLADATESTCVKRQERE